MLRRALDGTNKRTNKCRLYERRRYAESRTPSAEDPVLIGGHHSEGDNHAWKGKAAVFELKDESTSLDVD